jgi:hypothetical protein
MPKTRLKSSKASNSSIVNPIATWSSSLESYHPHLLLQKVSKSKNLLYVQVLAKKMQKAILVALEF